MLYDILFCLNIYGSYPLAVCTFCSVQLSCQDRNIDPVPVSDVHEYQHVNNNRNSPNANA